MKIPEYESALDWSHCENVRESSEQLSKITRLLNTVIMITKKSEMELLLKIAEKGDEINDKGSKDNKLIKLLSLDVSNPETKEQYITLKSGKTAISVIKNKRDSILEGLLALKKIEGYRP